MKKIKIIVTLLMFAFAYTTYSAPRTLVRIYEDFKLKKISCEKWEGSCLDTVTVRPKEEPKKVEEDYHEYDKS